MIGSRPVVVIAVLLSWCALAVAQPQRLPRPWEDPDARDYDAQQDRRSAFWVRYGSPGVADYRKLVTLARKTIERNQATSASLARDLLKQAVRLQPKAPDAHFWLGFVEFRTGKWQQCVASYEKARSLDANFAPNALKAAGRVHAVWRFDYALAECYALADKHQRAVPLLKSALWSKKVKRPAVVYWRLGEAYMALGRLNEAIASLEQSIRSIPGSVRSSYRSRYCRRELAVYSVARYALAVAYDRNEQFQDAARQLASALRADCRLETPRRAYDASYGALDDRSVLLTPQQDIHYYKALAMAGKSTGRRGLALPALALVHARQFANDHRGPWARRAKAYLKTLERNASKYTLDSVRLISKRRYYRHARRRRWLSATADLDKVRRGVRSKLSALNACLAGDKYLVVAVRAKLLPAKPKSGDSTSVTARVFYPTPGKTAKHDAAAACVRRVAQKLSLPKTKETRGRADIEFLVARN